MPKVKLQIITLATVALLVLSACGGGVVGGGSQSSPASPANLSGSWSFTTSSGVVGQLALNQQGAQITGSMSARNYSGSVVPGMGNPSVTGTLTGSSLQGTITGSYGPIACGEGIINIGIVINLTGTVSSNGNSLAGQFVTEPASCFSGNSGNWSAARMSVSVSTKQVTSVAIQPLTQTLSLSLGPTTVQYIATATYQDGSTANVTAIATWTSTATNIAIISPTGVGTAIAVGTATVTATYGGVTSNGVTLNVTQ